MEFSTERLRGHRHGAVVDLDDLSRAVGLSAHTLAELEAGRTRVGTQTWKALAKALDVPLNELTVIDDADYVRGVLYHCRDLTEVELDRAAAELASHRER